MKLILKLLILAVITAGILYHMMYMRGYFSVGGEIIVPIVIAILMFGGNKNGQKEKQCRSDR